LKVIEWTIASADVATERIVGEEFVQLERFEVGTEFLFRFVVLSLFLMILPILIATAVRLLFLAELSAFDDILAEPTFKRSNASASPRS